MNRKTLWSHPVILSILIAGLLGMGTWLEEIEAFQPLRQHLQAQSGPRSWFPGNRTIRVLGGVGAIHPDPSSLLTAQQVNTADASSRGFRIWAVGPGDSRALPSTMSIPQETLGSGLAVMSISLDEKDLRWLHDHPRARGREAERVGFVSFFDQGELMFGTGVGIRVHGGLQRSRPHMSYRLYFRPRYGRDHLPPGVIDHPTAEPIRRLVLQSDLRRYRSGGKRRFLNPIAYDISRQAGAIAPATRPVILAINGVSRGLYILTEYFDDDYLESRYGHRRFVFLRTKSGKNDDPLKTGTDALYQEFQEFVESTPRPDPAEVEQRVDLENLARWFVSVSICGTTDAAQGPLLFDETQSDSRWFWLNWDMDHSFKSNASPLNEPPWEVDLFKRELRRDRDLRTNLLRKLIATSSAYRDYLLEVYTETINHRVTEKYLGKLLNRYELIAHQYAPDFVGDIDRVRHYLANRGPALRAQMGTYLKGGASYPVTVVVPAERKVEIDGNPTRGVYSGWYYQPIPIRLRVGGADAADFAYWQVGKEKHFARELALVVDSSMTIAPVFDGREESNLY